jgi:hypothetical protein
MSIKVCFLQRRKPKTKEGKSKREEKKDQLLSQFASFRKIKLAFGDIHKVTACL